MPSRPHQLGSFPALGLVLPIQGQEEREAGFPCASPQCTSGPSPWPAATTSGTQLLASSPLQGHCFPRVPVTARPLSPGVESFQPVPALQTSPSLLAP